MRRVFAAATPLSFVLTLTLMSVASASSIRMHDDLEKLTERAQESADVLSEIMSTPESIPISLLKKAECLAVIPRVIKAALGFGGRHGKGLVSCRTERGWSQPSFVALSGGSFGLQIGVQATDFVLVFVNRGAARRLLSDKFTLGADVSVSAGPVGRTAEASTDVTAESEIFAYSRSRGLFAGVSIEGAKLGTDEKANRTVYGDEIDLERLLFGSPGSTPSAVVSFVEALRTHASSH